MFRLVVLDMEAVARTRARWQGQVNVERYALETELAQGPQHLKNRIESDIVRRYSRGERLLDVGIGIGRVSLPLVRSGLRLTGVDTSAAMIERCASDARACDVRLVHAELERLPFAAQAFDTVISVDTFTHFADWQPNLRELLRVTRTGGRTIVDIGSQEHITAVAARRSSPAPDSPAGPPEDTRLPMLRLSSGDLQDFAAKEDVSLVALVPYGAILGELVPNAWISDSYAVRSGGIDRLVSWLGADSALFAFAEFLERRIVQHLPPAATSRMFAVFERVRQREVYHQPSVMNIPEFDERGRRAWHAEFAAHIQHEPSRSFAITFLLACARKVPDIARTLFPDLLRQEFERAERAVHSAAVIAELVSTWSAGLDDLSYHGVDLASVFGRTLERELSARFAGDQ